ncbi:MAG: hypothetical protein ACLFUA_00755, partial [Spirochaetales bacterium]
MQVDRSELAVRKHFVALREARATVQCRLPLRAWVTEVRSASFVTICDPSAAGYLSFSVMPSTNWCCIAMMITT